MYSFSDIIKKDTSYNFKEGIYYITEEPFNSDIKLFLSNYYAYAQNKPQSVNYETLPFVEGENVNSEWKFRQESCRIVNKEVEQLQPKSVLEIGPWNGWLTHHLSKKIDNYVAVDIFDDEVNGLGAFKHYQNQNWIRVHADVESLNFFATKFDLIIYNHCLQFFSNWQQSIDNSLKLLNKGGAMIVLGCSLYSDGSAKAAELEKLKNDYQEKTGHHLFFKPTKGYFDGNDKKDFRDRGFNFLNYNIFYKNRLLSYFDSSRPKIVYAKYENK